MGATHLYTVLLIRYDRGMGRAKLIGPATTFIAGELRAQQARKEWSLDQIAERSGVSRSTVDRALKGDSALSIETLMALCDGMGLDLVTLMVEAQRHVAEAHDS